MIFVEISNFNLHLYCAGLTEQVNWNVQRAHMCGGWRQWLMTLYCVFKGYVKIETAIWLILMRWSQITFVTWTVYRFVVWDWVFFFFSDCNSSLIQHSNCSMTKMLNVLVVWPPWFTFDIIFSMYQNTSTYNHCNSLFTAFIWSSYT